MSNNNNNNNRANGGGGNKVKDLINDIEKGMKEDDNDNDKQEVDHHPSLSSIDNQLATTSAATDGTPFI